MSYSETPSRSQVPIWFLFAVMALTLLIAVGFLYLGRILAPGANLPEEELKILSRAYDRIEEHYIYDLSEDRRIELMHAAVEGMVEKLDKYSRYYPPKNREDYDRGTRGVMTGIGVVIQTVIEKGPEYEKDSQYVVLLYPIPGGPAERAGLKVGDIITAVEGIPVETTSATVEAIKGELNTETRLTIVRGKEAPRTVVVKRDSVIIQSLKWARILDRERGIGYVFLDKFTENSAAELDFTLSHLDSQLGRRLQGLVFDLRQNPGGLLDTCLEVTNRFIKEGTLVTLKRRTTADLVHSADPDKCTRPDLALAIILDFGSASASEVFSGALQDHGRARLVGTRSYGKGVVQSVFSWMDRKERVKITTSYYLTPNGRNIENSLRADDEKGEGGIVPDREVKFAKRKDHRLAVLGMQRPEVPRKFRKAVDDLCASNPNIRIFHPLDVDRDVQLAAALEEVRAILEGTIPVKAPEKTRRK